MLLVILVTVCGVLAALAWVIAAVEWVLAIRHRAEGVSLQTLLFHGFKSFDPASFDERGKKHQGRFLRATAAFFFFVLLTFAIGALSGF